MKSFQIFWKFLWPETWHLGHWLHFWQLRTTISTITLWPLNTEWWWQHSQFLRCFSLKCGEKFNNSFCGYGLWIDTYLPSNWSNDEAVRTVGPVEPFLPTTQFLLIYVFPGLCLLVVWPLHDRTFQLPQKTRRCTTVRNSDEQAIPLRWARIPISIWVNYGWSIESQGGK